MKHLIICVLMALLQVPMVMAINNGLGLTPPMGWNTWCTAGACERDYCWEDELKQVADAMATNGMIQLGYEYINMDDCWASTTRDSQNRLQADPTRFPNGLKPVADYIHTKGFKFGLYTDAGLETCRGGRPGSYGHYEIDAQTFAEWGMDYVKMDWCNTVVNGKQLDPREAYHNMSMALNSTGRPIFFNLCEWGYLNPWEWGAKFGNSWRSGPDHHDTWIGSSGVAAILEHNVGLARFAGPGGWNDMDFLMTGGQGCAANISKICPGMTQEEYKTEFSMWCLLAAPLIVATDVRPEHMTDQKKEILFNTEVIAINQDKLGKQGDRVGIYNCGGTVENACQLWAKPLTGGTYALALYNADSKNHTIQFDFSLIGWTDAIVSVRDLWQHKHVGNVSKKYTAVVPSHGVSLVKVKKIE